MLSCSVPIGKTHLTVPQFPIYNMEIIVHSDACLLEFCFFSLSLVLLPYFGSFLFLIFFSKFSTLSVAGLIETPWFLPGKQH